MAGYGNADDASEASLNHASDALTKHLLAQGQNRNHTGRCLECDDPIPPARLLAIPNANYCTACQSGKE